MLFLLVLRCGKHKPKLQDNDLIGGVASQSFLKASNNRSIFLVLMRMEAEATVQQIQTCLSTLRAIKPGEVNDKALSCVRLEGRSRGLTSFRLVSTGLCLGIASLLAG